MPSIITSSEFRIQQVTYLLLLHFGSIAQAQNYRQIHDKLKFKKNA